MITKPSRPGREARRVCAGRRTRCRLLLQAGPDPRLADRRDAALRRPPRRLVPLPCVATRETARPRSTWCSIRGRGRDEREARRSRGPLHVHLRDARLGGLRSEGGSAWERVGWLPFPLPRRPGDGRALTGMIGAAGGCDLYGMRETASPSWLAPRDVLDAINRSIKRSDHADAGRLRLGDEVRLGEVEAVDLVDLKRA